MSRRHLTPGLFTIALVCACSAEGGEIDEGSAEAPESEADAGSGESEAGAATSGASTSGESEGETESGEPDPPPGCENPRSPGATAECLTPTMEPEYYVQQAEYYFDTLDTSAPPENVPNYHEQVARWEWPPWLLLTGYGDTSLIEGNDALKIVDPSTVPFRDCRFFEVQPFARCYVEFEYEAGTGPCRIYEEFIFNDAGEMTWIEAWSDLPGYLPQGKDDLWAEDSQYPRLGTRIPGLGNATGTLDLESQYMLDAVAADPEVADFAMRAADWVTWWLDALDMAAEDFFALGCDWDSEPMP